MSLKTYPSDQKSKEILRIKLINKAKKFSFDQMESVLQKESFLFI